MSQSPCLHVQHLRPFPLPTACTCAFPSHHRVSLVSQPRRTDSPHTSLIMSLSLDLSLGYIGIISMAFLHAPHPSHAFLCTISPVHLFLLETCTVSFRCPLHHFLVSRSLACVPVPPLRHLERLLPVLTCQINAVRWRALL